MTKDTLRFAGKGAHLVLYGSMAGEDLLIPPSLLIFKDIHVHGFWRTKWFNSSTFEERSRVLGGLVRLMASSKVTYRARCHVSFGRLNNTFSVLVQGAVTRNCQDRGYTE